MFAVVVAPVSRLVVVITLSVGRRRRAIPDFVSASTTAVAVVTSPNRYESRQQLAMSLVACDVIGRGYVVSFPSPWPQLVVS